jgi:beta-glucosidase
MTLTSSQFPDDFTWGTATASYQIEGAVSEDGRGTSIWDSFTRVPGAIADGSNGDVACDHYHRFAEDVGMMVDLGVNSYRFSVAWPRVQPMGTGMANPDGLRFYSRLAETLLENGITPFATLYHWDLPQALEDNGGWLNRDTAYRFADYSAIVVEALGGVVDNWITLNEPWCSAFLGYAAGIHAPGKRRGSDASHAAHHLLLGHGLATRAIRSEQPTARVGVTLNLYSVRPDTETDEDVDAARRIDGLQNRLFLDPILTGAYPADVLADLGQTDWFDEQPTTDASTIAEPLDFLGVNYYSRHTVAAGDSVSADTEASTYPGSESVLFVDNGEPRTQMDWPIVPEGLVEVLRFVEDRQPGLPTYITENGSAFADLPDEHGYVDDPARLDYLQSHLAACAGAITEGLPLAGYFAWSLMDNFEWAEGFTRRFGLASVDYSSQRRTLKRSGRWFGDFLASRVALTTASPTAVTTRRSPTPR